MVNTDVLLNTLQNKIILYNYTFVMIIDKE